MTYKPTKKTVLLGHYHPPGFLVFNPGVCEELCKDGYLELRAYGRLRGPGIPSDMVVISAPAYALTEKGIAVVQMWKGERDTLWFRAANWVLVATTE